MFLAINYPSWIQPEILPGVPFLGFIRWYGLMYIFAFATAYKVFMKQVREGLLDKKGAPPPTEDEVAGFFTFSIVFLLVGARLFSTLIYDTSGYYLENPLRIFWPFSEDGRFTGLVGMSYHGGWFGAFLGTVIWCIRRKRNVLQWVDAMAASIPLGYTFGRIGNFFNAELYGRITTMPWGMIFPNAQKFSASLDWVREFAEKAGLEIAQDAVLVNLPRHPSQLYEAFFEGIVLWFLCYLIRRRKPFHGFFIGFYTFGYGFMRFFIEYFREPDADLGYRIQATTDAPIYLNVSMLNISTGQIFCLIMMAVGLILLAAFWFLHTKKGLGAARRK